VLGHVRSPHQAAIRVTRSPSLFRLIVAIVK
jgi:hypothetical protein